jgi:DNA mismatch endonuclease, patch repair protein
MQSIRAFNTVPERTVRSLLHKLGYRFRLNNKKLPGTPDIVLAKYSTVIFVHGCFWHRHSKCKYSFNPASNVEYWKPKLKRNVERDKENIRDLKKRGWKVIIVWQCELRNPDKLQNRLKRTINIK